MINGKKIFASLAGSADYYGVLCTEKKENLTAAATRCISPSPPTPRGWSVVGDWDPLGMRGTVSRDLLFEDVFVPDDAALMPKGIYFEAATRWPHMFTTLTPSYMGIAQAAYDFTVRYLRGEVPGMPPVKRRMYPTKQHAVAEDAGSRWSRPRRSGSRGWGEARPNPSKASVLRAYCTQYTVMETANDLCQKAIRTCGGQSMLKSLPLERLYRDSRCGSLMLPWTAELCVDKLGREALYRARRGRRMNDLSFWVEKNAAFKPSKTAIRFEGEDIDYAGFAETIRGHARALKHVHGVEPGDRVAFLGFNGPAMLALFFACARIGAIFSPLNWRLVAPEIAYILGDSAPRVLIADADHADLAREAAAGGPARVVPVEALARDAAAAEGGDRDPGARPETPCLLVYTSGTTGHPKGAVLTQRAIQVTAHNCIHYSGLTDADRVLTVCRCSMSAGSTSSPRPPSMSAGR